MAHILTEAARLAIDRSPIFWYSAQYPGTGKTLLSEMPATIVHGTEPALRPWVDNDEEMRKTLFSSLLAGDRSIAFDNLSTGHKIRSRALCAFATAKNWQDRKLGVSETPTVINCAVVSASGNNITPAGDLSRRSIVIRLDSNAPIDELRRRKIKIPNLRKFVLEHRVELLMAALTIISGHKQSDYEAPVPLPSFETWSHTVRDSLLWLGMTDPVETQQTETEDDSDSVFEAFQMLGITMGGREFTATHLISIVCGTGNQNVAEALQSAGCTELQNSKTIGYWLRQFKDHVAAGYKLEQLRSASKATPKRWRFRELTPVAAGAAIDEVFAAVRAKYAGTPNAELI